MEVSLISRKSEKKPDRSFKEQEDVAAIAVYLHPERVTVYWTRNVIIDADRAHAEEFGNIVRKTATDEMATLRYFQYLYFELIRRNWRM